MRFYSLLEKKLLSNKMPAQCLGVTKDGSPCKRYVDVTHCFQHQQQMREHKQERAKDQRRSKSRERSPSVTRKNKK